MERKPHKHNDNAEKASQSTPWVYFNKTGEGETGRGHNL